MPSELTLGAEYSFDELEDRSIGYDIDTDQTVHIVGGYLAERVEDQKMVAAGRRPRRQAQPRGSRDLQPPGQHPFQPLGVGEPAGELRRRLPRSAGFRRGHAHRHRGRQAGPHPACRRSEGGTLAQREPFGRSLPHVRKRAGQSARRGILYQTGGCVRPAGHRGHGRRRQDQGALQRFGRHGARTERRGPGGLHPLVRTPGGNDVAAEPLLRTRAVERGCGGASRAPDVPHARSLRLFHRVVQAAAPLHGRRDRNLHGGDARAAHGRIGGGPGCGGHHAGVLRREPAAGLRPAGLQGDHAPALRRRAESVRRLPEGFRPGSADRDSGYVYGPSLPRSWFVGAKISF